MSRALVAHTCNPSYSGGRDQEDFGSKPAQAKKFVSLSLKTLSQKIGLVEWLKVRAPSSIPSTTKKKKKRTTKPVEIALRTGEGKMRENDEGGESN
jgi:hypothetical protein